MSSSTIPLTVQYLTTLARNSPITTGFGVFLGIVLANSIYNRYFHPLRKFPGPFWASITDFYKLWLFSTKQAHSVEYNLHKKYGPIVRIAPNLLAFDDPRLLPTLYHRNADKTDFYHTSILGNTRPAFQIIGAKDHLIRRKLLAPSFSPSTALKLEKEIDHQVTEWVAQLKERFAKTGHVFDLANWLRFFAYDMVVELAFGQPLGFIKRGVDVDQLIKKFHGMAPFAGFVAAVPWIAKIFTSNALGRYIFMPKPGDRTGTGQIMAYRDRLLADRFNNPVEGKHNDVLESLLNATHKDGTKITMEEVKAESFVMMVAATDSASGFMTPMIAFPLQRPEVYAKLMAEIAEFEAAGKLSSPVATYHEIQSMPYFQACVKEVLRHSPSTPMILPRLVSEGGAELYGQFVPAGSEVAANPWVTNRQPAIYGEDADEWRPERWLECDEERAKLMERFLFSFGYGQRRCLGKNIAKMETQKICMEFFRNFVPSFTNPEKPLVTENWSLQIYWDVFMTIKLREERVL